MIYVHACVLREVFFSQMLSSIAGLGTLNHCTLHMKSVALAKLTHTICLARSMIVRRVACIRQRSLIQTENDHRLQHCGSTLSENWNRHWPEITETKSLERQQKQKKERKRAEITTKTVSASIQYTHIWTEVPGIRAYTSLVHRENVFHFSCSLFIVIIFRIYMFDFIIIRVTSNERK